MAPYKSAAATCLVALYALQPVAADPTITYKFKAVNAEDDAYLAAKLVRNGKLPVHISEVAKNEDLVLGLQKKVAPSEDQEEQSGTSSESCQKLMETSGLKDIFHHAFPDSESYNYSELFQEALDQGLAVFKENGYQNKWDKIWKSDAGASLAYLLASNSTMIGCVIGKCIKETTQADSEPHSTEEPTGEDVLFCELRPAADKSKAPFDEEYFNGLIARTDKLASMTEDDLKAPSNDATAAAAVHTILAAGLIAMLVAASA
ncbi:SAG family member [Eimeria brunetti]|uniref:SAG family member n=1 Tax=Eimeria brunetti TaxID=51314 RepID=U6L5F0_9EIME|nr:SAG family member [Eimeria brunetti]